MGKRYQTGRNIRQQRRRRGRAVGRPTPETLTTLPDQSIEQRPTPTSAGRAIFGNAVTGSPLTFHPLGVW